MKQPAREKRNSSQRVDGSVRSPKDATSSENVKEITERKLTMAWLLFMDESGHSHKELPYEVRGGFALVDTHLWPFVQDALRLKISCFDARLAEYKSEIKGMKLLSKDRFQHAEQMSTI